MTKIKFLIFDKKTENQIGHVLVNLLLYLKRNIQEDDISPIEDLDEMFPVIRTNKNKDALPEKIGEIDIKISCRFERQKQNVNKTKSMRAVSENRGKYARPHKPVPQDVDSSFLKNELKVQEEPNENNEEKENFPYNQFIPQKKFDPQGYANQTTYPAIQNTFQNGPSSKFVGKKQTETVRPDTTESEFPQKMTKEGLIVSETPNSIEQILFKAKNLQNKLSNFQMEAPNQQSSMNYTFQNKMEEDWAKPTLSDHIGAENKFVEYPIEKIGDIVAHQKKLSPELELQKLKLDEAGYMDQFDKNEEGQNKNTTNLNVGNYLFENYRKDEFRSNQKNETMAKSSQKVSKKPHLKNYTLNIIKIVCTHPNMLEKFRKSSLDLVVLLNSKGFKPIQIGKFAKEKDVSINRQFELGKLTDENFTFTFKILSSLEKVEMELAKGNLTMNLLEIRESNGGAISVEMFSGAIPEQISKKEKPKVVKSKIFKEDNLKKIENETRIGEVYFQIIEENDQVSKNFDLTPNKFTETEMPQYHLLLNIEKISNLEFPSNILIRYKIYSSYEKMETPVFFNIVSSPIDHRISMPMNSVSLQKTEKIPLVLEIWDKQENDKLIGLVHLSLKSIYSSVNHDGSSLALNKFPLIVIDDNINIKGIAGASAKGILTISVAFGTLVQISKFEQALKERNKINVQPTIVENNNNNSFDPSERRVVVTEIKDKSKIVENTSFHINESRTKVQNPPSPKKEESSNRQIVNEPNSKKLQFLNASDLKENLQQKDEFQSEIINPCKTMQKFLLNLLKNQEDLSLELKNVLELTSRSEGFVKIDDFEIFLRNNRLNLSLKEISLLVRIFDYENQKRFPGTDFGESYKSFVLLENRMNGKLQEFCSAFEAALSKNKLTIQNFEKELIKKSDFGYIPKKSIEIFLLNDLKLDQATFKKLEWYFSLEELVFVSGFIDKINAILSKRSIIDKLEGFLLGDEILDQILAFFSQNNTIRQDLKDVLMQRKSNADPRDFLALREIMLLFKLVTFEMSFFEAFLLIISLNHSRMKTQNFLSYDHKIEAEYFCAFFLEKLETIKEHQELILSPINKKQKHEENDLDEINDLNSLLNENKNKEIAQKTEKSQNEENIEKDISKSIIKSEPEPNINKTPNSYKHENLKKREDDRVVEEERKEDFMNKPSVITTSFQHQMKLKCYWLENLDLSKTNDGKHFSLRYKFPNEENVVESKTVIYDQQKKNYEILLASSHSIILKPDEEIKAVINERNALVIQMVIHKNDKEEIIGKTIIPLEIFFSTEALFNVEKACNKSKSIQIFPIYSEEKDRKDSKLLGKLHFRFTYKKIPIEDQNVFSLKQTKFQKFLPKKGFLNVSIEKITNIKSLLEASDLQKHASNVSKRDFFTSVYCEPFFEDEDLNQLFSGFETPLIYEKLAYCLNFLKSYPVSMNSVILDYFQTKRLRMELRLYFKNKDIEEENQEFIVLGYCEIPLIGLIINVNGLINEDFCLKNENSQFLDVFVKVNISFTEKPNIIKDDSHLPPKPFGLVSIDFAEIIYDEDFMSDMKELSFGLSWKRKNLRTGKFNIKPEKNGYLSLLDVGFVLKTENSQELTLQPLEIKIISNDDNVLGYLNLDLSGLIKPNADNFYANGYFVPMDPDCLKSNSIKLRVGIKCFGLFFENEPTMTRNQQFFEKINPKNCMEIQKMIASNKNFKLWEAIKIVLNLSPFELNKMTMLFENFENLHLVFSNEICNHLNQENQLDDLHFRKELMKEFSFYDYDNSGYVDIDNAQRIFMFFGESFQMVKKEKLKQFLANNINNDSIDSNGLSLKVGYKFDYMLFLQKLFRVAEINCDREAIFGYQKIYQNSAKIEQFYTNQPLKLDSPKKTFNPFNVNITLLHARNLDSLNRGLPPNCYFSIERLKVKTELFYRMKDPLINYSFSVEIKNETDSKFELSLYSRNYNIQSKDSISDDLKIGEITINLTPINESLRKENEITISHQLGNSANISIKYSLSNKFNLVNDPFVQNKVDNEFLENEILTNDLIENFHKTLNEINRDVNIYDFAIPNSQKNYTNFNQQGPSTNNNYSNEKDVEYEDEEPSKLEKTMMELDELKKNLTQILETNPQETNQFVPSETAGKGFSFGNTPNQNNNPFENFLYQSNVNLRQEVTKNASSPERIFHRIEEEAEKSSGEKTEKKFIRGNEIDKNVAEKAKFASSENKPPLFSSKNGSLKNLKQIDNALKNDKEYERIANIMKGNFGNSKKFYDFSSDSDA